MAMISVTNLLLTPLTIGNPATGSVTLPNRVILPPMGTEMGTHDGHSTPREAAYYAARARGGTGLVMTGINFVSNDFDPIAPGLARIDSDEYTSGIKGIADAVHNEGGLLALQLTMGLGRNNQYCQTLGMEPRSSSDNTWYYDASVICKPLEIAEIEQIIAETGEAARRAKEAGVDVIDIHGHTGYLMDQFVSACWNRRDDIYGGSVENRCRFAREIIAVIKKNAPGLPVSFRISVDHKFEGGRTSEETIEIVKELEEAGVDLLLADHGSYEAIDYVFPPYYLGDDCMVSAAEVIKPHVSIPVVACGNITPANGEKILARGAADAVAIGRGLIADPDIVAKLKAGQIDRIRPCIRCNQLCTGNAYQGRPLGCAVNPMVGREGESEVLLSLTTRPRHVVIIGAGPAGLEAARVAGLRGHTVDVYERADNMGGVLVPAATPEFKRELRRMIDWWNRELALLPTVNLHFGVEITADSPELRQADEIIVASGSHPIIPPIPGIDGPNVMEVIDAHTGGEPGHRVVVCGGGLSGADLALELADDGHEVHIVEMGPEIAPDLFAINRVSLLDSLAAAKVSLHTSTKVTQVTSEGITADSPDGQVTIDADTVVAAFGVRPAKTLPEQLAEAFPNIPVRAVGDCVSPRKVGDAINEGFDAALAV